jgi:sugar-specific transcriptional regulator TrmB
MRIDEKMELLRGIGLSDREILAYSGLLKLGPSSATQLAKEVGLKRTTVYSILENLIRKEIVSSYRKGHKAIFDPLIPNKLLSLYERKLESLTTLIPYLEKIQSVQTKPFGVRFIQTRREFESFYNQILDEYKDRSYYIIGNANTFINIDTDFILKFRKNRALRNIHTKLILSHDSKAAAGQDDPSLIREFKYLPEKYVFKSTIDIYDDKILIVGPEVKSLAVVIAVPPMVDVFRSVFEVLWENIN